MMKQIANRLVLVLLSMPVAIGLSSRPALGQAPQPFPTTVEAANDVESVRDLPADELVPLSDAKAPTVTERLDRFFAEAVNIMAKGLFFRIGTSDRQYIQFDEKTHYVRAAGSDGDFVEVGGDGSLSLAKVKRLYALGELETSPFGLATMGDAKVDYVTVKGRNGKYVLVDDLYHLVLPKRELLSDSDTLTKAEVEAAAAAGLLATTESGAYLQTENVGGAPVVVLWLSLGAIFFTRFMRGYNSWGFRHSSDIVRGVYDDPSEPGEVTHFQALASALSATVGLGNIAGVTIAMTLGGPGAFFWMLACGVFGMASKFVECTLGQKYRQVKEDGTVLGGPMQYLHEGLKELGLGPFGLVLSIVFAVMCILASFGGGNMFQANQSGQQMLAMIQLEDYGKLEAFNVEIKNAARAEDDTKLAQLQVEKEKLQSEMTKLGPVFLPVFGVFLAIMVGIVIIGGIKRIGAAASRIVPTMCILYVIACLYIIVLHAGDVPELVAQIFREAFSPVAFGGGLVGVLVIGVQRAAFSNEAGVGSASIAHSAAKTDEPVREGTVALMGPFIDTVVVCSMTALVILITGAWNNDEWIIEQGRMGTPLTSKAFAQEIWFFPYVLSIAVVLFAYSTIISWSYYGERCWERLFGARSTIVYKTLYVIAVFVGSIVNLGAVLDFSDMMILSMAFPNILGMILLSPKVRRDLVDYWKRYKGGEFQIFTKDSADE